MMEYTKNNPLRVVTLCSGYDSQCMALGRLERDYPGFGYECVAYAEIDRYAIQAHDAVFPQYKDRNMGDITSCDWTKITQPVDLLIYSTPCTSISNAGKQEGLKRGSGTASSIIWSVLGAIDTLKPKYLLMENVKALVSKKFMPDFREWYNELTSRGYNNFWKVLNAKNYGVPQNRERVFMVSILDDNASYHFPEPFPLERRLKDILEDNVDEKYYLSDKLLRYIFSNGGKAGNIKGGTGTTGNRRLDELIRECEIPEDTPACQDAYNRKVRTDGTACTITTRTDAANQTFISEPSIYGDFHGRIPADPTIALTVTPNSDSGTPINGQKVVEPVIFQHGRGYIKSGAKRICPSITTSAIEANNVLIEPIIAEPQVLTPKRNEYGKSVRKAYESGEVDESRHNMTDLTPREDGIANTLTSVQKDNLLLEVGNYLPPKGKWKSPQTGRVYSPDGISPTLDTMQRGNAQPKIIEPSERQRKIRVYIDEERKTGVSELQIDNENACASTVTTAHNPKCYGESTGYRIRKLTPRECFRLMDVDEENIDRIQDAGISNSQQYKLAGNSIVISCLYHIFRKLFIDKENENKQLTLF